MRTLVIHPELRALIPPLSSEERKQLVDNLRAEGCRDALVIWQEENTILDGHNRYDICQTYELPFDVKHVSLSDIDEAKIWMLRHQLGRRNLLPDQMSYLRGQERLLVGLSHGGDRKSSGQNVHLKTDAQLADEHKVSEKTIRRDAAYANAVDTIAEVVPNAKQGILSRDTRIARKDVMALARIAQEHPEVARDVLDAVQAAPNRTEAKATLYRGVHHYKNKMPLAAAASDQRADAWEGAPPLPVRAPTPPTEIEERDDEVGRLIDILTGYQGIHTDLDTLVGELDREDLAFLDEHLGAAIAFLQRLGQETHMAKAAANGVVNGPSTLEPIALWKQTLTTLDRLGKEIDAIYPTLDADEQSALGQMMDVGLITLERAAALFRPVPPPPATVPWSKPISSRKGRTKAKKRSAHTTKAQRILAAAQTLARFRPADVSAITKTTSHDTSNVLRLAVKRQTVVDGQRLVVDPETDDYVWIASQAQQPLVEEL